MPSRSSGPRGRRVHSIDELLERGAEHHRAGRLDDAAAAYDEVLRRSPKHAVALSLRGTVLLQKNEPAEALGFLDRSLAARANAGVHLNRGNALRALGRLAESADAYRCALALDATLVAARSNLGNALKDQGDLESAIVEYRRALVDAPDFLPAAVNLGWAFAASGDDGAALESWERAIELGSEQPRWSSDIAECHASIAEIRRRRNETDGAIEAYEQACSLQPRRAEYFRGLSLILESAARYGEAEAALRRAIELTPESVANHQRLALLLRRLDRNDDAGAVYREWYARAPDDPIAAHMAMAFGDAAPAPSASTEYVRREFDSFADKFDEQLRTKLDYRAPELIASALPSLGLEHASAISVADLGCGTGLCAEYLRPIAGRLVGIDLSPRMLDVARGRGLYDELVEAEIVGYCGANRGAFSLLVAADVLVYIGALEQMFAAARACLTDRGWLVFTVEDGGDVARGYAMNAGGRYTHDETYVRRALEAAGLAPVSIRKESLRTELRKPVLGWLVVARATVREATP